jgi:hypothetical protein
MKDTKEPKLYAGRIPCALYVEQKIFTMIEEKRGKESRNSFLNGIIENSLKAEAH